MMLLSKMCSLTDSEKYCLSLYFPLLCFIFCAILAIIMTTMTKIMNGPTQLYVIGDEVVVGGLGVVLEAGGLEVVVLAVGGLGVGFGVGCSARTRLFHVAVYPLVYPLQ
jgi:hypothetical protein